MRTIISFLKMSDWQPMETAPQDGTRILVCKADDEWPVLVYWSEFNNWSDGDFYYESKEFDLWMPAPKPPLEKKK